MGNDDAAQNKMTFDMLYVHKEEIEGELVIALTRERTDQDNCRYFPGLDSPGACGEKEYCIV